MNEDESWRRLTDWLHRRRKVRLARGKPFNVVFDRNEVVVTPTESGIERRISREEWSRFVSKFNSVESDGYDPLRPGHYARVTFNSSYLVAMVKKAVLHGNSGS